MQRSEFFGRMHFSRFSTLRQVSRVSSFWFCLFVVGLEFFHELFYRLNFNFSRNFQVSLLVGITCLVGLGLSSTWIVPSKYKKIPFANNTPSTTIWQIKKFVFNLLVLSHDKKFWISFQKLNMIKLELSHTYLTFYGKQLN